MKIILMSFVIFFFLFSPESWFLYFMLFFLYFLFYMMGDVFSSLMLFDSFSVLMCLLSLLVSILMILSGVSFNMMKKMLNEFIFLTFLMLSLLFMSFVFHSFFLFYISFELVVIPTFFMILGLGYSVERLQAGLYMYLYTIVASLPFLFLLMNFDYFSLSYLYMVSFFLSMKCLGNLWWLYMSMVFMVKLPMYIVHLWLPKAHVEAPLAGSMILAGVLLKLGGYGIFKAMNFSFVDFVSSGMVLYCFGLIGAVYMSLVCMRQIDLKSLIAYSSVVHMGPVLCSIMNFSWLSWMGSFYMMLSHGICSSGLFYILNVVYERWSSRSVLSLKGNILSMPVISFWWFFLCISNMGCPPTFNFVSEFFMTMGIMSLHISTYLFWGILLFSSGVYSIYLFVCLNHGTYMMKSLMNFLTLNENLILFFHSIPLMYLFLSLSMLY